MKRKMALIPLFIGIIFIVIAIILIYKNNASNNGNNTIIDQPEEREIVDISTLDSFLISSIPHVEREDYKDSKFVYQDKKITINDFSASQLYSYAFGAVNANQGEMCVGVNECDIMVKKDVVSQIVNEMFGTLNMELPNEIITNQGMKCRLNSDYYICENIKNNYENNAYVDYFPISNNYLNINFIIKAEKDSKNLYIYEKYINARIITSTYNTDNIEYYNYYLYKNSNTEDKIVEDKIIGKEYFEKYKNESFSIKLFEQYGNLATTYIHTFKIEDNTYKWVSTEPVI